ncbi:MAG: nucleotide pyrophosphohydrolase [Desulfobulbus sp.]|nr:nucleotide pyrophosphohydrolase [Desulfobulbus sp.]
MTDSFPKDNETCSEFAQLVSIVTTLRSDNGCPWDKKQTSHSLKKYLLEECQELIEAIDNGNAEEICEETGDLLFILTLLTKIFSEERKFTISDVLSAVNKKMIRRHPHVFGDVEITDEQELRRQWQRIKEQEKQSST